MIIFYNTVIGEIKLLVCMLFLCRRLRCFLFVCLGLCSSVMLKASTYHNDCVVLGQDYDKRTATTSYGAMSLSVNQNSQSLFWHAVRLGDIQNVKHLSKMENNLKSVERYCYCHGVDYAGTALHFAAHEGNIELTKVLLNAGAHVDARDSLARLPMSLSGSRNDVYYGYAHTEMTRALADYGYTPLHVLANAKRNKEVIACMLLEAGADVAACSVYGATPLHRFCLIKSDQVIRLLLEFGSNATAIDRLGRTPLQPVGSGV